jgi:hypothetical protein
MAFLRVGAKLHAYTEYNRYDYCSLHYNIYIFRFGR